MAFREIAVKYRYSIVTLLQKEVHDNQEELFNLIESRNTKLITQFYRSTISPKIKIARWNPFDYSSVKVLLVIIFMVVLFICVDVDKFSTGKIYSIVAYLWTFIASTEYLRELMESLASVKDLNNRFSRDLDNFTSAAPEKEFADSEI